LELKTHFHNCAKTSVLSSAGNCGRLEIGTGAHLEECGLLKVGYWMETRSQASSHNRGRGILQENKLPEKFPEVPEKLVKKKREDTIK
jgi:hypothetical protein